MGASEHTMGAPEHATKSLARYTNMGIKYAYPDPTNASVVIKTISNVFCAHFVHTMDNPEHTIKSLLKYTNMGIKYTYPDPTNTSVVLKTISNVVCVHYECF